MGHHADSTPAARIVAVEDRILALEQLLTEGMRDIVAEVRAIRETGVTARSLSVVDGSGEPVVSITGGENGGGLVIVRGSNGRPAITLGADIDGGVVAVSEVGGAPVITAQASEGDGRVTVADADGGVFMVGRDREAES